MNRVKVSEATGPVLDWMVAWCEGLSVVIESVAEQADSFRKILLSSELKPQQASIDAVIANLKPRLKIEGSHNIHLTPVPNYSTNWAQGGPIIEREGILLRPLRRPGHSMDGQWLAMFDSENTGTMVQWVKRTDWHRHYWSGTTPLVAAMRCYVASEMGDEVETPEGLNHG